MWIITSAEAARGVIIVKAPTPSITASDRHHGCTNFMTYSILVCVVTFLNCRHCRCAVRRKPWGIHRRRVSAMTPCNSTAAGAGCVYEPTQTPGDRLDGSTDDRADAVLLCEFAAGQDRHGGPARRRHPHRADRQPSAQEDSSRSPVASQVGVCSSTRQPHHHAEVYRPQIGRAHV